MKKKLIALIVAGEFVNIQWSSPGYIIIRLQEVSLK